MIFSLLPSLWLNFLLAQAIQKWGTQEPAGGVIQVIHLDYRITKAYREGIYTEKQNSQVFLFIVP
jgi:hypothetical protein